MLDKSLRDSIIRLIKSEVIPAIGCTEPMAVALCVAKATSLLDKEPDHISVTLSGNMLKNAMGVGIPGTGMSGLKVAIALGALAGKAELGLEVLRDITPEDVEAAKSYMDKELIDIQVDQNAPSKLFISVVVSNGKNEATAVIAGSHTNFISLTHNEETILDKPFNSDENEQCDCPELSLGKVWEFATESPLDELEFILEAKELNMNAARHAMEGGFGHELGHTMSKRGHVYFGNSTIQRMLAYTSAACDARMAGALIPVMSNSGSGNQGITATVPVVTFAADCGASLEQTIRALGLSHLTSIYIQQSLGRLSALCGCVVASTGASAGIVYLMGGNYREVTYAVKNMVANLTGMICDGAKPACALKISSGVGTALMSAMMAMNGRCVASTEGIVAEDVDDTIHNLTSIGRDAMDDIDSLVLQIMTSK